MNRILGIGVPAAGLVALGAATSSLLGIGVAGAAPAATTAKPATITMYANVDQYGNLGSHVGAVSASPAGEGYDVTFNRTISSCAALAQPGYAAGTGLKAGAYSTEVVNAGTKGFAVFFYDSYLKQDTSSAFMITVTCKS